MKGYLNNADATARTVNGEGWLRTGDIGVMDDEGYLTIVDRLKELIDALATWIEQAIHTS